MKPLSSIITETAEDMLTEHYGVDEATVTVEKELESDKSWTLKATTVGTIDNITDMCIVQADSGTSALIITGTEDQYYIMIYVQHKGEYFMEDNGIYVTDAFR